MVPAEPGSPMSAEQSQRRERAAIAAQACETCRARKSKCDEQRPKCSLCRRLNHDCQYREPLPTKKDKSLEVILASLDRLETKVNAIGEHMSLEDLGLSPPASSRAFSTSASASSHGGEYFQLSGKLPRQDIPRKLLQSRIARPYKVILWPTIYSRLWNVGVSDLDMVINDVLDRKPWLLRVDFMSFTQYMSTTPSVPTRSNLPSLTAADVPHYAERFPELTEENLVEYSNAYFDSYNILLPIFERKEFMERRLPVVIHRGFGYDDPDAAIVLGIAALGKMADKGISDQDLSGEAGQPASYNHPIYMPGADIFNAFQRRVGGMATGCAIEIIQIALLQALYYGACGRYINAWRSIDWTSVAGVSISRAYWICFLLENWYSMDLDLPRIVLSENLSFDVPLTQSKLAFDSPEEYVDTAFLTANVTLCRLSMALKDTLSTDKFFITHRARSFASNAANFDSITDEQARHMQEAADRMGDWREQLPAQLSWTDENRPVPQGGSASSPHISRVTIVPGEPLANPDRWTMVTAQLRNRFYFMRSWIFQPYIYQALHLPEEVKRESADEIARCLQDILLAPVTIYPFSMQKLLVPDLFSRSSNFLNSLLILQMVPGNKILKAVARERLDETEYTESIRTYLSWLKDMKAIDGIAAWSWSVLLKLYPGFGA